MGIDSACHPRVRTYVQFSRTHVKLVGDYICNHRAPRGKMTGRDGRIPRSLRASSCGYTAVDNKREILCQTIWKARTKV